MFIYRLKIFSEKEWSLIDSKEGILAYSDKKGLNLSKINDVIEAFNGFKIERTMETIKNKKNLMTIIGMFISLISIHFIGRTYLNEYVDVAQGFISVFLMLLMAQMFLSLRNENKKP